MMHTTLSVNQSRRQDMPFWMLVCFAMFNTWQMGFIYFMGPSLVLNGRTPLPIDMDNVTMLIAASYVLSIIYMCVQPYRVVQAARASAAVALASVIGLFLPLSAESLTMLLYVQTFCCCFMIGFETFIISNLFTERSTIVHLTTAYAIGLVLIAFVQNDWFAVSFPVFRLLTLFMVTMLLVFLFRLSGGKDACPIYVKKGDGLQYPKRLFVGIVLYSFVADIMMLGGPTAAAEVPNGIFWAYMADAAGALILYVLYRKAKVHPLHAVPIFMSLSVVGYLFLLISTYLPAMAYPACVLIGFGFLPCQFMPLFGMTMIKSYPSRYIAPGIIGMALVTVLVHSSLVEVFRSAPSMLLLAYVAITVVSIMIYWHLSPFIIHVFQKKIPMVEAVPAAAAESAVEEAPEEEEAEAPVPVEGDLLSGLTAREREVLELIGGGYSNKDIAAILVISQHTVNDYTKKIYRKLGVHSRHAAAQIINRNME